MKVYRLPERLSAIILDVDGTLYDNPAYASFQNDTLIARLASERSWGDAVARAKVAAARAAIAARGGSAATSLGNAFLELGVPIQTSVAWRRELIRPEAWLSPDPFLRETLATLAASCTLAIVTNNPRSVGLATLKALGVADLVSAAVGLDDSLVSKPAREPFDQALRLLGAEARETLSVGDRYDVDLAFPLGMGMGAVLVDSAKDLYRLPEVLGLVPASTISPA